MTTTATKAELRAAALRIVTERGTISLDREDSYALRPYVESHYVLSRMQDEGLVPVADPALPYYEREREQAKYTRQAKVILDQLASDGELLRFSSRGSGRLPQLSGNRSTLTGNMVGYITPDTYAELERRAVVAEQNAKAEAEALNALLAEAEHAGLPTPIGATTTRVIYTPDQLRLIIQLCRG